MKKQLDIKKLVLLNLPYLLMGLFATNFGEAWRLAQGANTQKCGMWLVFPHRTRRNPPICLPSAAIWMRSPETVA